MQSGLSFTASCLISLPQGVIVGLEETMYSVSEEDGAMIIVCVVVIEGVIARDVVVNVASMDGTATCESIGRLCT